MKAQTYRVQIKTLTPLHLGTGQVFEPTEFFVHPREGYLGVLNFERFVAHFSSRELQAFMSLCRKGTVKALVDLYQLVDGLAVRFLREGFQDFIVRRVALSSGFLEHYKQVKALRETPEKLNQEFNKFTIYRTAFSQNEKVPIIPGSAIKGAIRTAVLNLRRGGLRDKTWRDYCQGDKCNGKTFESDILGYQSSKFQYDPFRLVKVSDFRPTGEVNIRILYALNFKKDGKRARGPYQMLEVVEPGAVFEGKITVLEPEKRANIRNPVTFEEITQALKAFYGKENEREFEELKALGANPPVFPGKEIPLRLGRHSGAECVTVEGFRRIKIHPRENKYSDHATTLWLASESKDITDSRDLKPFGWVSIVFTGEA